MKRLPKLVTQVLNQCSPVDASLLYDGLEGRELLRCLGLLFLSCTARLEAIHTGY